jgi:hypothetical protein
MFHYTDDHILFIHSSVNGHLGCSYFWEVMNNFSGNMCEACVEKCFLSARCMLGVELLGHMEAPHLTVRSQQTLQGQECLHSG